MPLPIRSNALKKKLPNTIITYELFEHIKGLHIWTEIYFAYKMQKFDFSVEKVAAKGGQSASMSPCFLPF